MLDDFLVRAALAGVGTAIAAALLGCFVVWRRMTYFGDATAHAAILGVALALAFDLSVLLGVLVVALAMVAAITGLVGRRQGSDTVLGVMAHGALATGLFVAAMVPQARVNLDAYLFGDVLAVGRWDLALIWGGAALVAGVLAWRWQRLLTATISPDLAHAAGITPRVEGLILTALLAAVVAVALQVVGALLITAFLIIPAATARSLSRTPEGMALAAVLVGVAAALGGLWLSLQLDTPVGPTMVVAALALYALSQMRWLVRA